MKIIIAGAGEVGAYLTERLVQEPHDLVVIDLDEQVLEGLSWQFDIQTVMGSASSVMTLNRAGIDAADIFVAATDSDEANLIACLLAHSINDKARKIARVRTMVTDESGLSPRIREVFDQFINPDLETAASLLRLFQVPGACDVIDFAEGRVRVIGFTLGADSPVIDRPLRVVHQMEDMPNMLVVAIDRHGHLIIPHGDDELKAGDTIYVANEPEETDELFRAIGVEQRPIRKVMIFGGNAVGQELARNLVADDIKVKLIEADPQLCATLADELDDVLILQGEGTDQALLLQEAVEDIDVFVGATGDDEDNILSALLAKRLGANAGAAVIHKTSYLKLVTTIGVDIVVSPRIAAGSSILKFVREGTVSSAFLTRDDAAEVLEIIAPENSKLVNTPLRDVTLPQGAIIAAIVNENSVTIPIGSTVITPGDRVIIFANQVARPKLEKLLKVQFSLF